MTDENTTTPPHKHKGPGIWIQFTRTPNGWRASIHFKLTNLFTEMKVSGLEAPGAGPSDALQKAVAAANVLAAPAMLALMPPGTAETLATVSMLADAGKAGSLSALHQGKKLWHHFTGAFKSLAKNLADASDGRDPSMMGGTPIMLMGCRSMGSDHRSFMPANLAIHRAALAPVATLNTNPFASLPPPANPFAQNPWAPFATPNASQSPAAMAPPDIAPPPDATNYDGTPNPAGAPTEGQLDPSQFAAVFDDPTSDWDGAIGPVPT
jgi:hypothetical protein